ncbi:ATP-binding cassette domain-containing protein [Kiritimatiellaeota bacterium B1221]|nr:ATP-binding cassette domain-containing protein [Kiritimatiellaeota bacterium B1221]
MKPLLHVQNLKVWFPKEHNFFGKPISFVKAVDDVCFTLKQGETLGIVGESGSGKSTTAYASLRALTPTAGKILLSPDGKAEYDLAKMNPNELRPLRRHMQMVFQDPFSSLNPRMTVQQLIAEPLVVNKIGTPKERTEKVKELLSEVGLNQNFLTRYPHAFSGGQRQRIVIARALALNPKFIVCDEAVSALDVSVQAQILNLMMDLKERFNLSYLFIAHDLEVVRHIADRVAVMYAGRLVEAGDTKQVFENPMHPYTESLLRASPRADPNRKRQRSPLRGEVPDPSNLPSGCVFHPRCPKCFAACDKQIPVETHKDGCIVRCLLHEKVGKNQARASVN